MNDTTQTNVDSHRIDSSNAYKKQSVEFLRRHFPLLSMAAIRAILVHNEHHFTRSFYVLASIDTNSSWSMIVEAHPYLRDTRTIILQNQRVSKSFRVRDQGLLSEQNDIPELCVKQSALEVTSNNEQEPPSSDPPQEEVEEAQLTCECCFGDYNFEQMCHCNDGRHLFCLDCLGMYVKEEVFGNDNSQLVCMSSADGCTASFSTRFIDKALPDETERLRINEHMMRANIDGVDDDFCECNKCKNVWSQEQQFPGELAVLCPNNTCNHRFCRLCHEAPHDGMTCQETKLRNQSKASSQARVAEAVKVMNNAVVRKCPGCGTEFQKSTGCNHITCPKTQCKTHSCYLCRQVISGEHPLRHFCRKPHCTHEDCGECVLFKDTVEDDQKRRREAGHHELQKALAAGDTVAAEGIQAFLSPPKKARRGQELIPRNRPNLARVLPNADGLGGLRNRRRRRIVCWLASCCWPF